MIRRGAIPLLIAVLTGVSFLPTLSGSFLNWDDNVNFIGNPAYRGLSLEQIRWAMTSMLFGHYIPLTRLTWCVNYVLGGMDPWGYHLVNVLLHAANAVILYFVARRLLAAAVDGGRQPAHREPDLYLAGTVAALVFGLHPLRVEPVAWITGRADVLCTTFVLLAVWAYLGAVEGGGPARPRMTLVAAAAFAAALLSKGSALPLPAALLLLDVYPLRRFSRLGWRSVLREKIPLLVVMLAGLITVAYAVRRGAVLNQVSTYGPLARITAVIYTCVVSLGRFFWPASLSPLYEMPARISLLDPKFGMAVAAAALVTAVLILVRRRWAAGLAVWVFSALMLAPISPAVRQGADLAPDRYSYLAGLGLALLAGGAALTVSRLVRRGAMSRAMAGVVGVAAAASLVALGAMSWSYAEVWKDSEALWRWSVELDPDCSVCQGKLGETVLGGPNGVARVVEAEAMFRRAIALRPDLPDPYFNLGTALVLQGRYADAEAPLRGYMERMPQAATGPERLGVVYLLQRRYEPAVPLLRRALLQRPDTPGLRGHLVEALQGRAQELRAQGRGADADVLVAEARALGDGGGPPPSR